MSDSQTFICGGSGELTPEAADELARFAAHLRSHREIAEPGCRFCIEKARSVVSLAQDRTEPADCRSEDGETVGLIDSGIIALRLASRRPLASDAVQSALQDLRADREVMQLYLSPRHRVRAGPAHADD